MIRVSFEWQLAWQEKEREAKVSQLGVVLIERDSTQSKGYGEMNRPLDERREEARRVQ